MRIMNDLFTRPVLIILLAQLSFMAAADPPELTEAQRQQLMEQAGQIEECIARVDQSTLQALSALGEKTQAEVQALCAAGKRDAAQQNARAFVKEMNNAKVLDEIKKCGAIGEQLVQQMPLPATADMETSASGHVCDGM